MILKSHGFVVFVPIWLTLNPMLVSLAYVTSDYLESAAPDNCTPRTVALRYIRVL